MEVEYDAVEKGLNAAFERTRDRFEVSRGQLADLQAPLISAFESWPGEAHPRFVTLFSELWGVAATARIANGEPQLTRLQIRDFLGHCSAYFNSFKHR